MLVRGLIVGLSIAAPVGPIGVLCVRRTLADGRGTSLAAGLGAAAADAIERFEAALRGFEAERFKVWRVPPGCGALPGLPAALLGSAGAVDRPTVASLR